jgi:hypothetical protein
MRNDLVAVLMMLPTVAFGQNARLESSNAEPARIDGNADNADRTRRVTLYLMIEGSGESPAEASQRVTEAQAVTGAVQHW